MTEIQNLRINNCELTKDFPDDIISTEDILNIPFFHFFVVSKKIYLLAKSIDIDNLTEEQINVWVDITDVDKIYSSFHTRLGICLYGHNVLFINSKYPVEYSVMKNHKCIYCGSPIYMIFPSEEPILDFPFIFPKKTQVQVPTDNFFSRIRKYIWPFQYK
jgi:hypothetical protein